MIFKYLKGTQYIKICTKIYLASCNLGSSTLEQADLSGEVSLYHDELLVKIKLPFQFHKTKQETLILESIQTQG